MRQRPSRDEEIVQASASVVLYDVTQEILTLEGDARVVQDETSIRGERIEYHLRDRRFQAEGAETDEPGRRVQIVLPAKRVDEQLNQDDDRPEDAADGASGGSAQQADAADVTPGTGTEDAADGNAGSEEPRESL